MIPESRTYFISNDNMATIKAIMEQRTKHPVNMLFTGKHGLGKSMLAQQIAACWKLDYVPVPICQLQEVGQMMGHLELKEGKTEFIPSDLVKAIQTPNTVIHLEELNRPESPKAVGELFPLLDDTRAIGHEYLGTVKVAPGVVFVGTLNEGFEYSGIDPMDEALRDRFFVMRLDYLPAQSEKMLVLMRTGLSGDLIDGILDLIGRLRFHSKEPIHISTRRVIMLCQLVSNGLPLNVAFKSCVGDDLDKMESILIELDAMTKRTDPDSLSFGPTQDGFKQVANANGYGILSAV